MGSAPALKVSTRGLSLSAVYAAPGQTVDVPVIVDRAEGVIGTTLEVSWDPALVEAVAAPNVYLYWQPSPGIAEAAADAEIAALGPHIAHLHVFEWDADKTRYPLADGFARWKRWIDAIPQGRWMGPRYAMLEFVAGNDPQNLLADARTLRRLIGEPPGA